MAKIHGINTLDRGPFYTYLENTLVVEDEYLDKYGNHVLVIRESELEKLTTVEGHERKWIDLDWDDYLELAGQPRFWVQDPHTGVTEFLSHEFTKQAIERFKEKNE